MAKTTGCNDDVIAVALVNEGFESVFVLNVHVKMHLRFGSNAVDRQLWRRHSKVDSDTTRQIETFSSV